jgi:4-hydroxybenzoate polyprenyltransferase
MRETQLSSRQIQAVVLVFVILMGSLFAYVSVVLPSNVDPVGSRQLGLVSAIVAALAAVWFIKLMVDAVRDRREGTKRGPAQVSGRFNVVFGALVAVGGITCSAITYFSAVAAGGGIWTLYYGMILWGIVQMFRGFLKLRDQPRAADELAASPLPESGTIPEEK